jgi:formiminotetrahydrofolate cyclodeaminase
MESIWKCTLEEIRISTGSDKPLATSGAVSIITAVYGCSLAIMALRLSAKSKTEGPTQRKRSGLIALIEQQALVLTNLADRDIAAFQTFLGVAGKVGKSEKKQNTPEHLNTLMPSSSPAVLKNMSNLEVTRIPLLAALEIQKVFPLIVSGLPVCRRNLLCDLVAAANNCSCAVTNLVLSVSENARSMEPSKRAQLLRSGRKLENEARRTARLISVQVKEMAGNDVA